MGRLRCDRLPSAVTGRPGYRALPKSVAGAGRGRRPQPASGSPATQTDDLHCWLRRPYDPALLVNFHRRIGSAALRGSAVPAVALWFTAITIIITVLQTSSNIWFSQMLAYGDGSDMVPSRIILIPTFRIPCAEKVFFSRNLDLIDVLLY